jgi:hypothetical protein
MDDLRGKYRFPYRGFDMDVGSSSAVLTQTFVAESIRRDQPRNDGLNAAQTFVAESIRRDQPRNDGLNAARGAVNAVLISLAFWIALGLAIFVIF